MGFQRGAEDAGGRQQFITASCSGELVSPLSEVHGMGMGRGDAFQAGSAQGSVLPEHEGASGRLHGEGRVGWGGSRGCAAPRGCPTPRQLLLLQAVNDPGVSWQE